MTKTRPKGFDVQRRPDFVLTLDELRAVTDFNVACAEQVIDLFEDERPTDARPREALRAAAAFAAGGPRSRAQRVSAPAAHRAAKEVTAPAAHAAMAAVIRFVSTQVVEVLVRYPRASLRLQDVVAVMSELDTRLRGSQQAGHASAPGGGAK